MSKLNFSTDIHASKEKVWDVLWSDEGYRKWTAVFMEGSYAESDWNEGSEIRFLSPGGNGLYSIIQKKVPFEHMVFEHRGEIKNGVVETKEWSGATEAYYLDEKDGITTLQAELEVVEGGMSDYFSNTFPKALALVKQLAEQPSFNGNTD